MSNTFFAACEARELVIRSLVILSARGMCGQLRALSNSDTRIVVTHYIVPD